LEEQQAAAQAPLRSTDHPPAAIFCVKSDLTNLKQEKIKT